VRDALTTRTPPGSLFSVHLLEGDAGILCVFVIIATVFQRLLSFFKSIVRRRSPWQLLRAVFVYPSRVHPNPSKLYRQRQHLRRISPTSLSRYYNMVAAVGSDLDTNYEMKDVSETLR
jgi:hypothetical protein